MTASDFKRLDVTPLHGKNPYGLKSVPSSVAAHVTLFKDL